MRAPDVSIILACYDEETHLRASVAEIAATMDASGYSYELIFVDDASRDATRRIIKELCEHNTNYRYLFHAGNVGRGGTVMDGLRMARGKVAGFLDVDLEVSPDYIPTLVSAIESGSCAVGTVARSYKLSWRPRALLRVVLSQGYSLLVSMILKLPFQDTETGYKFFDRQRIMPVIQQCRNQGWFWDTEIMALSHKHGLLVREIPGLYSRRTDKVSTVRPFRDTLVYAKDLFRYKLRTRAMGRSVPASSTHFSFPDAFMTMPQRLRLFKQRIRNHYDYLRFRVLARAERYILMLAVASVVFAVAFLTYHALIMSYENYAPIEKVMAVGLLVCEIYFAINGLGYVFWISQSRHYESSYDQFLTRESSSSVACLLPVCDEPLDTIAETLASVCAMRYVNKRVYVLDDSKEDEKARGVGALAEAYGATLIRREDHRGYKAGNINNGLKQISSDYIAIFDADQRPSIGFLRDIVPRLDENPKLALVQTRQDYENSESLIAHAAALQNALFYEYIAESKDVSGSMFCCGTNFVMRLDALRDVGGFDTRTLTEDFATTLSLHERGWETKFHDKAYVMGLGPETLGEYLKQYSRWATGTLQVLKIAVKRLFVSPRALTTSQWFEYWLSCSYYLSGLVNFYLLLLPPAYMLFGVNLIKGNPAMYLVLFFLVFMSFWSFFLFTSIRRGYSARDLITVCARLETCKFAVYSRAFVSVLLGRQPKFQVTEKGGSRQLGWSYLKIPLAVFALNVIAALVGFYRLGVEYNFFLVVNTFWSAYNVWQLSAIVQYNMGSDSVNHDYFKRFGAVEPGTVHPASVAEPGAG